MRLKRIAKSPTYPSASEKPDQLYSNTTDGRTAMFGHLALNAVSFLVA